MEYIHWARKRTFAALVRTIAASSKIDTSEDETLQVPSRDNGRSIQVHVYRGKTERSPVLINFHGGGFVLPLHGSDDEFCRKVRDEAEFAVLDVQYRLAPENPFPAACEDAEDVVDWVMEQARFDSKRVSLSGFSAGGNLALGLCTTSHEFEHVVAFYPDTNLSVDPGTKVAPDPSQANPLFAFISRNLNDCYMPTGVARSQPRLSPLFLETERYPKSATFITCGYDPLAPEAENLAEKMRSVLGKNVTVERVEKVAHAWDKECKPGTREEEQKAAAYAMAAQILKSL